MTGPSPRVQVVPYRAEWPARFRELHDLLWPHLRDLAIALEHVGSTSVPGLAAKPVIDLDVIVRFPSTVPLCLERLRPLGYAYLGEVGVPNRHAFKAPPHATPHHLYVCLDGSIALRNHLLLREHLRTHSEEARAYGELKMLLAALHPHDIDAYVSGKTDFILQILSRHGMGEQAIEEIRGSNALPVNGEARQGFRTAVK